MMIVPEIETVVIFVPRTGSGSLRRALAARYPEALLPYRHMEADGVPRGYDRWRRVGIVRHPLDRLWSLYKFMRDYRSRHHDPAYVASLNRSASIPFSDWIVNNQTVFTSPYDSAGRGRYFANFTVNHPLPENRKSQFMYLRPDLGTEVIRFEDIGLLAADLGVTLEHHNETVRERMPPLSEEAAEYVDRVFAWDFSVSLAQAAA